MIFIFDPKKDDTKRKEKRKNSKEFPRCRPRSRLRKSIVQRDITSETRSKRIVGKEGGEAEGECARSSEIISWCPLQATKEEERKRTGLSQSFLDTRRSFYCEKLAG